MPTRIKTTEDFDKQVARLARRFPAVLDEVAEFISRLKSDDLTQLPGRRIRRTGFAVYKERLPNRSARRGETWRVPRLLLGAQARSPCSGGHMF